MMEVTAQSLIKRYDRLKTGRGSWEAVWDEIALYVAPSKVGFVTTPSKGDTNTDVLYDSTAIHSSSLLAAAMHSAMTSPSMVWFDLRFRADETNKLKAAKEWLEDSAERMDAEINDSSFNSEVNELYQDMIDFGTANQLVEMDEDGNLRIKTNHLAGVMFSEDKNGVVDTVLREFNWSARQIEQKWPDADLPKVKKALENNPDEEFRVIHACMPRVGKEVVHDEETVGKLRPFAEYYVVREDALLVEEGGTYELPYMTPRWSKRSGDSHGFSPAMVAMPDIKTLNRAKYLELAAWEKAIDPPMAANETDVIGDVDLRPSGLTMMRDINGIKPMVDATNWNATMMKAEELKESIRNIFFTNDLKLPDRPNATATEVKIRYEAMQRLLGSTFGRLTTEYLDLFVKRVFNLMMRAGKFKDMPEELTDGEIDVEMDIVYVSPLARSQRMDEVQAIQGFTSYLDSQAEVDPKAKHILNRDESNRIVAKRLGVPTKAIRSKDEIEEAVEKEKQEQEKQMQAMAAAKGGGGGQQVQGAM